MTEAASHLDAAPIATLVVRRGVLTYANDALAALTGLPRERWVGRRWLELFAPDDARVLRDRARLYEMLGGAQAAAADLERVLSIDPAASDAATLRARLARLRESTRLLN